MIQLYNVYKTYNGNIPALVDVSLLINPQAFLFVTGSSGAGKSTLLKLLYRWENFDSGQILVNGINIGKIQNQSLYLLRRNIGVVFQDYKLLPYKTVFENVAFALEVTGQDLKTARYQVADMLNKVGLFKKRELYPPQLSGGEQQRVGIARALVNNPKILLADEPTGNLDSDIAFEILKLFAEANQQGTTVIFATHNLELVRRAEFPSIMLKKGSILKN
jgi:cell division transport system ATP-binding protein